MTPEEIKVIADALTDEIRTTLRMSRAQGSITTEINYVQQSIRLEITIH